MFPLRQKSEILMLSKIGLDRKQWQIFVEIVTLTTLASTSRTSRSVDTNMNFTLVLVK